MADVWFTIHRAHFFAAFAHVARAVEGRSEIPILTHVLLFADGETLSIRGTNLDLQIEAECELLSCVKTVEFALPAARLHDILRQLPESAEISFEKGRQENQVSIRSGRSLFSLSCLPATDFPEMKGRQAFTWTEINGAVLADAIPKASFAVSKLDDRPFLKGLCMHADQAGTGMVVCGTDGLVLARIRMPGAGTPVFPKRNDGYAHIILPLTTLTCIQKLMDGTKASAMMAVTDHLAAFRCNGVEITSKLIDFIFPDYERAIPQRSDMTIVISREQFISGVKRVCAVGVNPTGQIHVDGIRLKISDGALDLDLLNAEGGYARDSLAAKISAPDGFAIAHDASRLERALSVIRSSEIEIILTDEKTAMRIELVGRDTETYLVNAMQPRFVAV